MSEGVPQIVDAAFDLLRHGQPSALPRLLPDLAVRAAHLVEREYPLLALAAHVLHAAPSNRVADDRALLAVLGPVEHEHESVQLGDLDEVGPSQAEQLFFPQASVDAENAGAHVPAGRHLTEEQVLLLPCQRVRYARLADDANE